jgi:S-DNA-T family DNA segregation ATPase FtsK/SpoIIIE
MAYSNTYNRSVATTGILRASWWRFSQELVLIVGLALLIFLTLALLSYSALDPSWSTSGVSAAAHNWGGRLGAWLADVAYALLGYSAWWCVAAGARAWLTGVAGWISSNGKIKGVAENKADSANAPRRGLGLRALGFWVGLLLLLASSSGLEWTRLYYWDRALPDRAGGVLGQVGGQLAIEWLGVTGSTLLGLAALMVGIALVFRFSWGRLAERIGAALYAPFASTRARRAIAQDKALGAQAVREREEVLRKEHAEEAALNAAAPPLVIEPAVAGVPKSERVDKEKQHPLFNELPDSHLPQIGLLDAAQGQQEGVEPETLEMTSRLIEKKLKDFGVEVRVVAAAPGPVITRYEIEPATGVKGAQVVNLAKDLARSLSLVSIRVIETIPGKNYMALELPNARRQMIHLSEILGSQVYNSAKSLLTVGLGKDIVGYPVVADLAKMPHLLVAGTTGSGKSVGINAMILSLLYKAEPRDVRLLMIDPKMLEMSVYEGIPHLLAPVVTDMKQAANGLSWCVAEMERRYKLMSKMGVRNVAGFNQKIDEAKARGELVRNPFSLTPEDPEPLERLPFIVVVIDELADLMMVVGKKIEELIARLAQKARAAGIHLILATQRPSVDVITGLIKANIPTRIAFQVSSKIDSRTILDQMGAETLLGMGDMLYLPSGTGLPQRVHGAFVSDEEVHRVVQALKEQGEPNYIEGVLEGGAIDDGNEGGGFSGEGEGEGDPLYDQAVEIVLKNRKASISLVQRHLGIGYNKAANLLEAMEKAGLVSSMNGRGQREILAPVSGQE